MVRVRSVDDVEVFLAVHTALVDIGEVELDIAEVADNVQEVVLCSSGCKSDLVDSY